MTESTSPAEKSQRALILGCGYVGSALAQALALEPGFLKARYFRALLRFRLGRFDEALADFEAVRRSFPRDREVLFQLGRTLYVQGDYRRAVKIFEAMLVIDPEEARAYYNLMLCHRHLGEEERAAWAATQYETYRLDFGIDRVTGPYRNSHPQESREAELVHEHSHGSGEPQRGTGAP
ncbi:MAG: tetratricopeptide repeat protein [Gemmatimonadetes bacterium]|nr:tetratricopeptide repeat protein [Gemmatimonadota bacterium]